MINNQSKILLFGTNCASVVNNLCIGLKKNGNPVKAISFDYKRSRYNDFSHITCVCTDNQPGKLKLLFYKLKGMLMLIRWLLWCDVAHVYGNISKPAYWLISKLARHKFITFVGSDIRVPQIELDTNPYFKFAYNNEGYEYKFEKDNKTSELLHYLRSLDFKFIVWDVEIFIDEKFMPYTQLVPHAAVNKEALMPEAQEKIPLLVHSPTAPVAKGTFFVMQAVEELQRKNIPFEFLLLQHLPNDQYQQALAKADIYLDQFTWGAYGVAAVQALQMGKVVVNYLTPHRIAQYGPECPVQNVDPLHMSTALEKLIADLPLRQQLSASSRQYYEKTHSPLVVARKMIKAYDTLAARL